MAMRMQMMRLLMTMTTILLVILRTNMLLMMTIVITILMVLMHGSRARSFRPQLGIIEKQGASIENQCMFSRHERMAIANP